MSLRTRLSTLLLLAAVLSVLALARPALAQSPAEIKIARQTAGEALGAYKAGEFEKALKLFDQARAVYPSAQILRMTGYTLLALERWEQAAVTMEQSRDSTLGALSADDRKEVDSQLAKVLSHLGMVTVTTKVDGAKLVIDSGEPRPLPLDKPIRLVEGKHQFTVSAPQHVDVTDEINVEGGKTAELDLEPEPKAKPPPPPPPPPPKPRPVAKVKKPLIPHQKTVGAVLLGGGVVFGGAALFTSIAAGHVRGNVANDVATHNAEYGTNCSQGDPRLCAFDIDVIDNEGNQANQIRNASIGLGITAAVLGVSGVVLVLSAPREAPKQPADDAPRPAPPPGSMSFVRCGLFGMGGMACGGAF
jgi:hypothetical protein